MTSVILFTLPLSSIHSTLVPKALFLVMTQSIDPDTVQNALSLAVAKLQQFAEFQEEFSTKRTAAETVLGKCSSRCL
jgi:hypothetical protein